VEAPHSPYEPQSIEVVQARLDALRKKESRKKNRKGSAKAAYALGEAYDALMQTHYAEARALAKEAESNALFADYAHWIEASSFQQEASEALLKEKGDPKDAANLAKQAFFHFVAVENGNPYSALVRAAPKQAAISELYWAQGLRPGRAAVTHFQNAFERLSLHNSLIEVVPENIQSFAKACSRSKSDLCEPWIFKLAPQLPKGSPEYKAVLKYFPSLQDRPKAPPALPRATQSYKAPDLDTQSFEDAMVALRSQKWSDVQTKLQKFLDEFPKSSYRYRSQFWLAQATLKSGKKDESTKIFDGLEKEAPLTFFGMLSALATAQDIAASIDKTPPQVSERDLMILPADLYRLNRAEILLNEGANELAALELKSITAKSAYSNSFLMYLALLNYRAQNFPTEFVLLTELIQRSYPGVASDYGLKMIFPVVHFDLIKKHAKEEQIDPILVLSLIKQESAFDARISSGAGASGLMQLMPFTAVETVPGITKAQLLQADQNIHVGTRYLAKLLDRFKGNIVLALAGYNAGPGAVDRWVREGIQEKQTMIEFIEAIPYRETRGYVGSIIRNYYWYSKALGTGTPESLAYFWRPYKELNQEIGIPEPKPFGPAKPPALAPGVSKEDKPAPVPLESAAPAPSASPEPQPLPTPRATPSALPLLPAAVFPSVTPANKKKGPAPSVNPSSSPSSGSDNDHKV
jgi:soluble lytic murein transglycosylase-like protein